MTEITAIVTRNNRLCRVEASDGMTYVGVNDSEPGKRARKLIYETWPTNSSVPGGALDYVRMPRAVRKTMREHFGHPHYARPTQECPT